LPDRPTLALGDAVSASWIMKIGQHHKICCVFRCTRAFHVDAAGLELTEHRSPAHAAQRPRAAPAIIAEPNRGYSHVIFDEIICVHPLLSPRIQALLRWAHNPPEMVRGLPATPKLRQSFFLIGSSYISSRCIRGYAVCGVYWPGRLFPTPQPVLAPTARHGFGWFSGTGIKRNSWQA
jgi:hypothetical protein